MDAAASAFPSSSPSDVSPGSASHAVEHVLVAEDIGVAPVEAVAGADSPALFVRELLYHHVHSVSERSPWFPSSSCTRSTCSRILAYDGRLPKANVSSSLLWVNVALNSTTSPGSTFQIASGTVTHTREPFSRMTVILVVG